MLELRWNIHAHTHTEHSHTQTVPDLSSNIKTPVWNAWGDIDHRQHHHNHWKIRLSTSGWVDVWLIDLSILVNWPLLKIIMKIIVHLSSDTEITLSVGSAETSWSWPMLSQYFIVTSLVEHSQLMKLLKSWISVNDDEEQQPTIPIPKAMMLDGTSGLRVHRRLAAKLGKVINWMNIDFIVIIVTKHLLASHNPIYISRHVRCLVNGVCNWSNNGRWILDTRINAFLFLAIVLNSSLVLSLLPVQGTGVSLREEGR